MQLDHPLERVVQWRYAIIIFVSIEAGIVSGGRGDWDQFVDAGRAMFGSAGLHVYVLHHDVQTGPLSLFLAWLFAHTPRDGFVLAAVVSAALGIVAVRLCELTSQRFRSDIDFQLVVLVGGCLAAFSWAKLGGYGHLDDAITLTCAVIALNRVRAGKPLSAGLAIGIAIAAKPWGVIFLPLTLATRWRDLRAPIIAGSVAALAWLPFIVGAPDSLRALRPTVNVAPDSVLALFGVTSDSMPDWLRVAQLIACLGVAAVLALRRRPESVIAAAIAVRLASDPATWSYYTPGLVIGVLVWDLIERRRFPWATFVVVVGLAPTWLVPSDTARGLMRLAVTAGVVVFAFVRGPAASATPLEAIPVP
ncbi:MAG TPA: glycosyltransferase family 87 protein [Ilumatobacteraceae bacterium]|nr:glycosyltransferase family 87 protein [Ilumatobacteraceae bacterium]